MREPGGESEVGEIIDFGGRIILSNVRRRWDVEMGGSRAGDAFLVWVSTLTVWQSLRQSGVPIHRRPELLLCFGTESVSGGYEV